MIYLGNPSRPDVISAQTLICSSCCARWIQKVIKVGKRLPLHNIAYANTNTTDPTDRQTDWCSCFIWCRLTQVYSVPLLSLRPSLCLSRGRHLLSFTLGDTTSEIVLKTVFKSGFLIVKTGELDAPWFSYFKYVRDIHVPKSEWNPLIIKC